MTATAVIFLFGEKQKRIESAKGRAAIFKKNQVLLFPGKVELKLKSTFLRKHFRSVNMYTKKLPKTINYLLKTPKAYDIISV